MPLAGKPTPLPLPANTFPPGSPTRAAYDICVTLEQREAWNIFDRDLQKETSEHIMFDMSPLVASRILGHALVLAPSENGREALVREINDCYGDPELLAGLAHLYAFGLMRVFYNPKGPTPAVSADQSPRRSFEERVKNLEHILQEPLITPVQLRKLASVLFRDGHHCVFTGAANMYEENYLPGPSGFQLDIINVAHIISQSLSADIRGTTERVRQKFEWARTAGALIERFGGFSSHDVLGNEILNSPSNAFISSPAAHSAFDCLDMWLIPANDKHNQLIPNTYDVEHYRGKEVLCRLGTGVHPRITFRSAQVGDQIIPPPNPRVIALHAACARIAHMSGAAGWLREFFRDRDEISVMTEPNAAYELCRALNQMRMQLVSASA